MISETHKAIIDRYANHRAHPGSGFQSILANNIDWAILDTETTNNISNIIAYIRQNLPGEAFGSPEIVNAWLSNRSTK
jgi:hypothetical protein